MINYFKKFRKYAFRLELLQKYDVNEEKESFNEFLKTGKIIEDKEWTDLIKNSLKRGAIMQGVHVINLPLSDYLKYEIEMYKINIKSGERIFFVLKNDFNKIKTNINSDFWIFDDKIVLKMHYELSGKFKRFEEINKVNDFVKLKKVLLNISKPINELK